MLNRIGTNLQPILKKLLKEEQKGNLGNNKGKRVVNGNLQSVIIVKRRDILLTNVG